jgi:purine-binding chemotaxis protein CheW
VNQTWLENHFSDWSVGRSGNDLQIKNAQEAEDFLSNFYSPDSGQFWSDDYAGYVKNALPNMPSNSIQVWDVGCGKGYEPYSLACVLKNRYPGCHLKIWANDSDIMAISNAPNMTFELDDVPEYCRGFMVKGKNGYSFNQEIKDAVLFEYHDVLNGNQIPDVDMILVRDFLSFVSANDQAKMITEFAEHLKGSGIIMVGRHEELPGDDWQALSRDPVSIYTKA